MSKAMTRILLGLVALFFAATTVQAGAYVVGKGGFYIPDDGDFETGYGLRGAFGLPFGNLGFAEPRSGSWLDKLSVEAGFGIYNADVDVAGANGDLTVLPLTVSGVFHHSIPDIPIVLRAGAGLGLYFAEFDSTVKNKSEVEPGLYLHGGMIFNLNKNLGILGEVDYDNASGNAGGWMLNAGVVYRY